MTGNIKQSLFMCYVPDIRHKAPNPLTLTLNIKNDRVYKSKAA